MPAAINQAGEDDPGLTTGKTIFKAVASPLDGQAATKRIRRLEAVPEGETTTVERSYSRVTPM